MFRIHYITQIAYHPPEISSVPGEFNTVEAAQQAAFELEVANHNVGCGEEDEKTSVADIAEEFYMILGDENVPLELQDTVYLKQKGESWHMFIIWRTK